MYNQIKIEEVQREKKEFEKKLELKRMKNIIEEQKNEIREYKKSMKEMKNEHILAIS